MLRITLIVSALLTYPAAQAVADSSDDPAFKAQINACTTDDCLVDIAYLFVLLNGELRGLKELEKMSAPRDVVQRRQKGIDLMRAQLQDLELSRMREDGRWHQMTERQQHDYAVNTWHLSPDEP